MFFPYEKEDKLKEELTNNDNLKKLLHEKRSLLISKTLNINIQEKKEGVDAR